MVGRTFAVALVASAVAMGIASAAPNDPLYLEGGAFGQWNLMGTAHPSFPDAGIRGIDAEGAWAITAGRPDVTIAVVDSGVALDHPDLAANIDLNAAECDAAGVASGDGLLLFAEAQAALGDVDGDGTFTPLDVIAGCENGVDDDANGYVDDIAGWDFEDDDNVPMDDYGHGTGRAGIAAAVADNGIGMAGVCPGCRILPVRLGRTFVATPDKLAEAIGYAADRHASAAVMATGSLGNSAALRAAVDWADAQGVVLCAAIGNERSRHHHFPQSYENVIAVAGVTYAEPGAPGDFSGRWLGTNFGAHAAFAAPTFVFATKPDGTWDEQGGTSSSAPHCAGAAGLVLSRARDLGITLSARQVRSILVNTADAAPAFSPYAGTGRLNAFAAVSAVDAALLPPDARIVSPRWFRHLPPGTITVELAAANPADVVTLEYGYGAAPSSWSAIPGTTFVPSPPPAPKPLEDELGDAFAVTVRMTATAANGVSTVDRRTFFVHADPAARTGFPVDLGSSAEGAPAIADLDGDNRLETIVATNDGRVHALRADGTALAGWPVTLGSPLAMHASAPAHVSGGVPVCCSSLFSGVAAGDLDGDGLPEVIAAALDGRLYAWRGDATPIAALSIDTGAPVWAAPVLADLDADGALDVIVATSARRILALHADGTDVAGWPIETKDATADGVVGGLVATPAAGDIDGDGSLDVVIATTEAQSDGLFSRGRVYAFHANGQPFAGFPVAPFGLLKETFPVVGAGVATHPVIADLDGDGTAEILVAHAAGQLTAFRADGSVAVAFDHGSLVDGFSPFGPDEETADPRWEMNLALLAQSAAADLTNDGTPEILLGTMALEEVDIAQLAADPGEALAMLHSVLTMWRADGRVREPFPLELDGWTLFAGATIADLDADTLPEVILPTDGGWLHAWNARGESPASFPRFTGGWTGPAAAIGDLDADGRLDLVTNTREGSIFAWSTEGAACVNGESATRWASLHHDAHNTGALATDATPPAAIADARVEDGRVAFTAVGDDGFAGAAARYDARWSASAIVTLADFAAASTVEITKHPLAGTAIHGGSDLPAGAYVAVIAFDEVGLRSPLPASGAAGVPADPCVSAPVIHLDGGSDPSGCACSLSAEPTSPLASFATAALLALAFVRRRAKSDRVTSCRGAP